MECQLFYFQFNLLTNLIYLLKSSISNFWDSTGFTLLSKLGGDLEISMGDVLTFFTGAEHIPPLGFDDATLNFNDENPFPTASTCGICLTLPTKYYDSYPDFKEKFVSAMRNHGGFGLY